MSKINTHEIKIIGLKEAALMTHGLSVMRQPYVEIFYDRESHRVIAHLHSNLGEYTHYDSPQVIRVWRTRKHMSAQAIADRVFAMIDYIDNFKNMI